MKIRSGFVSNSSTSSFICEKKMTVREAESKLSAILDLYNELMDEDENLTFNEVFNCPFVADKNYCDGSWAKHRPVIREAKGKLIIEGAGDNSIPSSLIDLIEKSFNARRCRFG